MNNNEYYIAIEERIKILQELRKEGISLAKGIIGKSLFTEDLFFCASLDRCMNLIDGFVVMLRKRNLTCVGALLRLQMDNCMRSYAAFIAKDKQAVINCIISGEQINKQVSKDGVKMSDGYLKSELSKIDTRFANVYKQASGYVLIEAADAFIHFIKLHFWMLDAVADSKERVDQFDHVFKGERPQD